MALFSHPFTPPGAPTAATTPTERMNQILVGDVALQVVRAAAVHGLAEQAAAGPVDPADFAATAGLDAAATVRFLRVAAVIGLLDADDAGRYHGTPLLDTLRGDRPDTLRHLAMAVGDIYFVGATERLADAFRTGRSHAEEFLGEPLFTWFAKHPDEAATFTRGMAALTVGVAERVADVLDLAGARSVVDVGGGDGGLARAFLRVHPDLRATVLDLPNIVGAATAAAAAEGLGDRLDAVGGDFFAEVPAADVCLLKHIVHDWSDDEAATILGRCRDAVGPGGRVVVIDAIVGESGDVGPIFDMWMLALVSGRERTRADFDALLARAGLRLDAVVDTGMAAQAIVATPA